MINLILTAIAVITILPVVYFLPLGITNKGKGLILFLALALATFALVGKSILPIWEIGLFLILLIVFGTYLLDKRLPSVLYQGNEPDRLSHEEPNTSQTVFKPVQPELVDVRPTASLTNGIEDIGKTDSSDEIEPIDHLEVESDQYLQKSFISAGNDAHIIQAESEHEFHDVENNSEPSLVQDEKNIEAMMEELTQPIDDHELEEIILKELDLNEVAIADEEISQAKDISDEDVEEYDLEALLNDEHEELDKEDLIPLEPMIEGIKEVDLLLELEDLQEEVIQDQTAETKEELEPTLEEELLVEIDVEEQQDKETVNEIREIEVVEEVHQEIVDSANDLTDQEVHPIQATVEESFGQRSISYELMQTMVEQLRLARKNLSAVEYETLIKEHLLSELSLTDYYTFASLLIEHYIEQNNTQQLSDLIKILQSKYNKYPIIIQELQYFNELYC